MNLKKRKEERLKANDASVLSTSVYNLLIGLMVLYGLGINAIICALFTDFAKELFGTHPFLALALYIVFVLLGAYLSLKSKNPLISFIGYNLVVLPIGLIVSLNVSAVDQSVVIQAATVTFMIILVMTVVSCIFPQFFLKLGKALFVSLLIIIAVSILSVILGFPTTAVTYFSAGVFSLYIGYDLQKAQQYPKTLDNAVDSAVDIYLDVINLFLDILEIMNRD